MPGAELFGGRDGGRSRAGPGAAAWQTVVLHTRWFGARARDQRIAGRHPDSLEATWPVFGTDFTPGETSACA